MTMNTWQRFLSALPAALLLAGCAGARGGVIPSDPYAPVQGRTLVLFDGTSLDGWRQIGPGRFVLQPDGSIVSEGGMGLLYYTERRFRDFVLELEYKTESPGANSGIFVRFPEHSDDPWYAVNHGYEIQIDDRGDPLHRTGAIYNFSPAPRLASRRPGEWNQYRIVVTGQRYVVYLNGEKVNDFIGNRGREGFIGLQNHDVDSRVYFRNIRVTPLDVKDAPESLADLFAVREQRAPIRVLVITATHGFRHTDAIETIKQVLPELERTTEFDFDITEELSVLTPENLARYDVLFFANSTLRAEPTEKTDSAVKATRTENVANPVTLAQQKAILDFVRGGKGLAVAHAGLDAFYGWDGYREMVGGGLFEKHPWTQGVRIVVEEKSNPAVSHLGDGFWIRDEIYVLDQNPRWNSHVLLSLDMRSVGVDVGNADDSRDDYPISWIRHYGSGRVFVTKLGHFGDVWRNPDFLQHLLQGLRIAAGRLPAEFAGRRVKETIVRDVWPDDLAVDEKGNVWIAELTGRILRYDAATKQAEVIAEIPTTDPTNIEHGVYGIEVDPNFYQGEPYVYIYYAEPESFVNKLSRFTYRDGKLDMSSETVLLRVPTEPSCCHQAGDLEWGPDGTLFISTGDTGQSSVRPEDELTAEQIQQFQERYKLKGYHWSRLADSERTAQNLQDLRGKVLRINKDGSIPKDNPFYGKPGVRWEIWAYGLRNPYRIKYDSETRRLFIGIVGPDENTTYDWYDVSERGGENFGWPRATGRLFYNEWRPDMIPGYVPPIWEYTYKTGTRSATFGPIYRSDGPYAFPSQFQGKLFVFDWSRKWIKYGDLVNGVFESDTAGSVRTDGRQFVLPAKRLANLKTFDVLRETSPISMELGPDGCLYLAEFDGFWRPGPQKKANVSRYCWVRDPDPSVGPEVTVGAGGEATAVRP